MFEAIKNLMGQGAATDLKEVVSKGGVILDVRTKEEYKNGHIKGSVNIPLQVLESNLSKIQKDKPVITCCASGMRSASAKSILQAKGFAEVHNGGGWNSLQKKLL